MAWLVCTECKKEFKRKPCLVRRGGGKFCSKPCHYAAIRLGKEVPCASCGKMVYKTFRRLQLSKSKKYFCDKSCQTLWRNQEFSGSRHNNWKNGEASYRNIMKRAGIPAICALCNSADHRVIIVHHKDKNRLNNVLENLVWLCRNCHFLVHHYDEGQDRGLLVERSQMATVV